MSRIIVLCGILLCGCQNASSVAPPASSRKVDIHVDAPGVKVDANGQKREP